MNNQQSLPTEQNDHEQSRSCTQFPPDKPETWVIVGDKQMSATVLDESLGGIALMIESADAANLQVGDQLTVLNYGFPTVGHVRWIRRNQEIQKVCFGIRWSS
jgi:hypothetical protein